MELYPYVYIPNTKVELEGTRGKKYMLKDLWEKTVFIVEGYVEGRENRYWLASQPLLQLNCWLYRSTVLSPMRNVSPI
jgi:hypothetical protein